MYTKAELEYILEYVTLRMNELDGIDLGFNVSEETYAEKAMLEALEIKTKNELLKYQPRYVVVADVYSDFTQQTTYGVKMQTFLNREDAVALADFLIQCDWATKIEVVEEFSEKEE